MRPPTPLRRRLLAWGLALTWLVGGAIGAAGSLRVSALVREEAASRAEDAVRVAMRLVEAEIDGVRPGRAGVEVLAPGGDPALEALGPSGRGFVRHTELGLCLAAGTPGGEVALLPLRGANELPDRARDAVFGPDVLATVTIFEGDERIATNVRRADGARAVGTRASAEVARRVLVEGEPWNDRARVLDRWTVTSYQPLRSPTGEVVGMIYAGLDDEPYATAARREALRFLGGIGALSLVVSLLVGAAARKLSRPLASLTEAAQALGENASRPLRVSEDDPEEIQRLGEAFNRMAAAVRARTGELEESRAQAQRALDDYLEVLGFVAHELKSPLATARLQLELIEGGYVGEVPPAMREHLAVMDQAVGYGIEVATSFNQLCRAEGGGLQARVRDEVSFAAEVLRPAVSAVEPAARARGMSVRVEAGAPRVRGDSDLLRVAADNLLGNAVKYGREGTEILAAVEVADGWLRFSVRNEGPGVPEDKRDQLFRKFSRVKDAATRGARGTGVGLYLVRRFAELHGGRVGVEGEYGAWIRFWFEIPA